MRILVVLLLLANLTLFVYMQLDSVGSGEAVRLQQQVQPDKIKLLTPQQVAALGPAKVAALADVCVEWGPLRDADRARALAEIEPLDLGKLLTQKKVEVVTNYWVFLPPAREQSRGGQTRRRTQSAGHQGSSRRRQRTAAARDLAGRVSHARRRRSRLRCGARAAGRRPTRRSSGGAVGAADALVMRDPPATGGRRDSRNCSRRFPGSEVKIGSCEKTS